MSDINDSFSASSTPKLQLDSENLESTANWLVIGEVYILTDSVDSSGRTMFRVLHKNLVADMVWLIEIPSPKCKKHHINGPIRKRLSFLLQLLKEKILPPQNTLLPRLIG